MVNLLFEAGAEVNYMDSRGWTPLMIAASQGYEDLVEFLLKKNANVDLKDKYGKKASDKAQTQSIFYILSSAGIENRMKQSLVHASRLPQNDGVEDAVLKPSHSSHGSARASK